MTINNDDEKKGVFKKNHPDGFIIADRQYSIQWFVVRSFKYKSQKIFARGQSHILKEGPMHEWWFMAPNEMSENVIHDWQEYDSITSRLAEVTDGIEQLWNEGKGVFYAALATGKEIYEGDFSKKSLEAGLGKLKGVEKAAYRVDTPLVYKGSQRREISMTFELLSQKYVYSDILDTVKTLQMLSSPKATGEFIDIEWPYIFEVGTIPGAMVYLKNSALISVQPTYFGPYQNGIPTKCSLTLTFREMDPLYRDTIGDVFKDKEVVTTSETSESEGGNLNKLSKASKHSDDYDKGEANLIKNQNYPCEADFYAKNGYPRDTKFASLSDAEKRRLIEKQHNKIGYL